MNWMKKQVSLYKTHADNIGQPVLYSDLLLNRFANDLPAIIGLRKLDRLAPDYKIQSKPFKAALQCFTPASLLASKAAGNVTEINRTGLMQLDFDFDDIKQYDVEDLKQAVFNLPFIAFCGLSCSGYGFYSLALIAEPERLSDYAEHCFEILKEYDIKADESKGKKPENLRYLSYDANMLIRENPEPLHVTHFKKKPAIKSKSITKFTPAQNNGNNALLNAELKALQNVQSGERWATVQKAAFTIGGLNIPSFLNEINNTITSNQAFSGEETKYLKCAQDCFYAGMNHPLNK